MATAVYQKLVAVEGRVTGAVADSFSVPDQEQKRECRNSHGDGEHARATEDLERQVLIRLARDLQVVCIPSGKYG
jgi:hypothetical protein